MWSITFISACCRPWSLKRPISRNRELDRFVRKPQKCFFHRHKMFSSLVLHDMDCSSDQDMANFEESAADGKISSLSKSNHKIVTELIEVDWNVYFSSVSEIHYSHPIAHNRRLNIFQKVSPHPVNCDKKILDSFFSHIEIELMCSFSYQKMPLFPVRWMGTRQFTIMAAIFDCVKRYYTLRIVCHM